MLSIKQDQWKYTLSLQRILPYLGWNGVWLSGYRSLKRVKMLKVTPEGGGLGKASPEWKVFADEFDDVFNAKSGAFNAYQATVPKMKILEKNGRSLVAALEREYLVTLSSGGKRRSLREQPWVGDIVLVVELSTPPLDSVTVWTDRGVEPLPPRRGLIYQGSDGAWPDN
ncbi:hypothetical protein T08_15925 [Trichinella sp. T8]|nr:hypothetical protein T08_15925 [Trichinella sp. T8]